MLFTHFQTCANLGWKLIPPTLKVAQASINGLIWSHWQHLPLLGVLEAAAGWRSSRGSARVCRRSHRSTSSDFRRQFYRRLSMRCLTTNSLMSSMLLLWLLLSSSSLMSWLKRSAKCSSLKPLAEICKVKFEQVAYLLFIPTRNLMNKFLSRVTDIMHSDWLKHIMWFVTSNQNALFQIIVITLFWSLFMRLAFKGLISVWKASVFM